MSHPHRHQAMASSKEKMRRIGGHSGGGGSPFMGMSPHKRPAEDGEMESYHSHHKQFSSHATGKKGKARHGFKRGGAVKMQHGGAVPGQDPFSEAALPQPEPAMEGPPMGGSDPMAGPPMGGPEPMPPMEDGKQGEQVHNHKHFHVHNHGKKAHGGGVGTAGSPRGMTGKKSRIGEGEHIGAEIEGGNKALLGGKKRTSYNNPKVNVAKEAKAKRGGRYARGGRAKQSGPINIVIGSPPNRGGMGAPSPMSPPPAGAGAPSPPPMGAPPMGGAPGGMPPGTDPMQVQRALQAIAGGGGGGGAGAGGMGAGMPGQRPFKRGGKVSSYGKGGTVMARGGRLSDMTWEERRRISEKENKRETEEYNRDLQRRIRNTPKGGPMPPSGLREPRRGDSDPGFKSGGKVSGQSPGLTGNMQHWREYSSQNVKKNKAHEHGATGASPELNLKTRTGKARGGGTWHYPLDAGQQTGVGRKEQKKHHV